MQDQIKDRKANHPNQAKLNQKCFVVTNLKEETIQLVGKDKGNHYS